MIVPVDRSREGAPRQDTIGYAAFVTRRRGDPDFARWFDRLAEDISAARRTEPGGHDQRLVALQRALIDLIEFLDPDCERLPKAERPKLPLRSSLSRAARASRSRERAHRLDELRRLVDLEVDADHADAHREPVQRVVARAVLAAARRRARVRLSRIHGQRSASAAAGAWIVMRAL